ncbi:MAG: tannase/feruloyl esterase family alpha/beta hydrolase [Mycobacteriales bacterium]
MTLRKFRTGVLVLVGALAVTAAPVTAAATAQAADCPGLARAHVPGAQRQEVACLADLTTAGTVASGHTVPADYAGLTAAGTLNPTGVPGIQVDGYFPDSSTSNANHGWNHDSQFVLRLPEHWNGGLVITGAPGVRRQYANDVAISDWVLARGYAFAATDKGNTGAAFYTDGTRPGDAIVEWNHRVTQLAVAAKAAVALRYGGPARRTYVTGLSNGGYLARWQLENVPGLYDGGVDWEGTLFRADGPNLLTYLPTALRAYPRYAAGGAGSTAAHQEMIEAGFAPGSEPLWAFHYQVYWDLTQRIYREELDPGYDGALQAGIPFCASGTPSCDADYDYFSRPAEVRRAVARVQLTGRIGKPMLTLHGTLDTLLPKATDSDVYTRLIAGQGRGRLHRYYVVEDGNHVDGLYGALPEVVRPILPCYRDAFAALEAWVDDGIAPPPSRTIPRPAGDVVNTC